MSSPRLHGGSIPNEVGADRRLLSVSKPPDARMQNLIDEVDKHGFVIIRDAFDASTVAAAKDEALKLTNDPKTAGPAGQSGRNDFEGHKTQRMYSLVNKSRVFDAFALHEDVLALNDHFLDAGYLLNSFQSINILPGETAQTLHYDHGFASLERPHKPLGSVSLFILFLFSSTIYHHITPLSMMFKNIKPNTRDQISGRHDCSRRLHRHQRRHCHRP